MINTIAVIEFKVYFRIFDIQKMFFSILNIIHTLSAVKSLQSQLLGVFDRKLPLSSRTAWLHSKTLSFKRFFSYSLTTRSPF